MALLNKHLVVTSISMVLLAGCGGGGDTTQVITDEGELIQPVENAVGDAVSATSEATQELANTVSDAAEPGWTDMQENWRDSIGNIKDRWADLTEEELLIVNGDREQLVSLVQSKYGLDRETAQFQVNEWASSL